MSLGRLCRKRCFGRKGSLISKPDVSPNIVDKTSSSVSVISIKFLVGYTHKFLVDLLGTLTSLFGWEDFQSTEESSEGNRFHLCPVSVGILHDLRQATKQSFGGKMATGSETFFATCVFCWTCSAILNILEGDKYHRKETYSVKTQR